MQDKSLSCRTDIDREEPVCLPSEGQEKLEPALPDNPSPREQKNSEKCSVNVSRRYEGPHQFDLHRHGAMMNESEFRNAKGELQTLEGRSYGRQSAH